MRSQFRAQQREIMPAAPVDIILSHIMPRSGYVIVHFEMILFLIIGVKKQN